MRPTATIIAELHARATELDTLNRIMEPVKRSALIKEIYALAKELKAAAEHEGLMGELKASEIC